ncbi:MAG: 4-hydroxy-3-methylbut-2-enyl diphosphate reductase, partial [Desulfovibrio sp.]|nr:4-hydroxy-3-methylbut-2-enyl diphosphate reductase [Desulfovibrio sp.]
MQVIRAQTAGFCMGVGLALKKLDAAIAKRHSEHRIITLGPLIHNPQVLADYSTEGVFCVEESYPFQNGDCVVIRAHGIQRSVEDRVRSSGAKVIDATCPKVKKAQLAIAKATAKGAQLILFGESDHPEVRGLISYAQGKSFVIASARDLDGLPIARDTDLVLASQTTQDREAFSELTKIVISKFPHVTLLSTICDATRERQEEARAIAKKVEIMVVVGGRQSGNTRRLASVASMCGIETLLVETADELRAEKFFAKRFV